MNGLINLLRGAEQPFLLRMSKMRDLKLRQLNMCTVPMKINDRKEQESPTYMIRMPG